MADYYVRAAELAQDAMQEIAELSEKLAMALAHRDEWRRLAKFNNRTPDMPFGVTDKLEWEIPERDDSGDNGGDRAKSSRTGLEER